MKWGTWVLAACALPPAPHTYGPEILCLLRFSIERSGHRWSIDLPQDNTTSCRLFAKINLSDQHNLVRYVRGSYLATFGDLFLP